jgi:hydrogenase expression/formation protein HypC
MCLAVPARLIELRDTIGVADFGGVRREISVLFVPEVKVGDYVLIHAGSAIERLDESEAEETLRLFEEIAAAEANLVPAGESSEHLFGPGGAREG